MYAVKFGERLGYGEVTIDTSAVEGLRHGVSVVLGPNGAGKSTLGLVLEKGRYAYGNRLAFAKADAKVKMLTFTDIHSLTGIDVQRYDQRLEATENDFVPTVADIIGKSASDPRRRALERDFGLADILVKRVNFLSSGELRKFLLVNALLAEPDILILDNPYIGLDEPSRAGLDEAVRRITRDGKDVVMLICDSADIPDYADSVTLMADCRILSQTCGREAIGKLRSAEPIDAERLTADMLPPARETFPPFATAFAISDGHIKYGERTVIEGLTWHVGAGERWALTGANGSGKSLLLSMVTADNPQAYANNITLFDRRRGSGESIWDIKDRIAYVNPEMQLYFRSVQSVAEIVARASRPSLRRFGALKPRELDDAREWLKLLEIEALAKRQYSTLSSSEQRLVLLASAFIRQSPLLILDEPLHGLDSRRKERVRQIIDALAARNRCALIFVSHYTREIPSCVTKTLTLPQKSPLI